MNDLVHSVSWSEHLDQAARAREVDAPVRPLWARCFCVLGIIVRSEIEMIAATLRAQRAASGKNGPVGGLAVQW